MRKFKHLSKKYRTAGRDHAKRLHGLKNHPLVIPVFTFIGLIIISMVGMVLLGSETIGASDSRVVHVTIDGEEQSLPTRAKTVGDLLKRLDVQVGDKDIVEPAATSPILEDNMKINVQQARPVTIVDGGRRVTVLSPYRQPRTVVQKAGITLYPEDGIGASGSVDISDRVIGEQIVVDRAMAATINLYGNTISTRTRAKTVGELLEQKGIKTIKGDTIEPAASTKLATNAQVFVVRKGKQVITVEEAIPAPVANVNDANLAAGATVVQEAGTDGKKIVTYEVELRNGQEISRKALQEVIAVNPVRRVVATGTKVIVTGGRAEWLAAVGIPASDYYAVDYIIGRESGWCPTKWQGEYGGCPAYHGAPTSGGVGYGLCQATPGYKMASAGADWAVNPITQLRWCTNYAAKYGGWQGAYNFWVVNHWW